MCDDFLCPLLINKMKKLQTKSFQAFSSRKQLDEKTDALPRKHTPAALVLSTERQVIRGDKHKGSKPLGKNQLSKTLKEVINLNLKKHFQKSQTLFSKTYEK